MPTYTRIHSLLHFIHASTLVQMEQLATAAHEAHTFVDALELRTSSSASGVHRLRVCNSDGGNETLMRLTAAVAGGAATVPYFAHAHGITAGDEEPIVVALHWEVGRVPEHHTTQTLDTGVDVVATFRYEGRCFAAALAALKEMVRRTMAPDLHHRVVLFAEVAGAPTIPLFENAGFTVKRYEAGIATGRTIEYLSDGDGTFASRYKVASYRVADVYHAVMPLDQTRGARPPLG